MLGGIAPILIFNFIDSESKNIDIETLPETRIDGFDPVVTQKGINSTVTINMQASKGSLGLSVLIALMDLVFAKVTSKQYKITYLNGAVTIFNGLLHGFTVNQSADNDLYTISMQISRANGAGTVLGIPIPTLTGTTGVVPL